MPENVVVRLYDTVSAPRVAIELGGTRPGAGGDVTILSVTLTAPSGATMYQTTGSVSPLIPAAYIDQSQGASDLRLQRGPSPRTIPIGLAYTVAAAKTVPFLDRNFDVKGGVDLGLVLSIPGPSATPGGPPLAVLTGRGTIDVSSGAAVFAQVALGFRVVVDHLPSGFPSAPLSVLELELPGEIPWPPLRLPWPSFPALPASPLRVPALAVGLDALPVRVGFKAVELTIAADGTVTLHVEQLQIEGVGGDLGGTFDLEFNAGNVTVKNASFPALGAITNLAYKELTPGCFGFDWQGSPVDPLFELVSTEFADSGSTNDNAVQLRVHAPGGQIDEVRLDWSATFATRTFEVPGFRVTLPPPRMLSLVARRPVENTDDGGVNRLTLAATFDPGPAAVAESTFSWPLSDSDREMLRDGNGTDSNALIRFTATPQNPVSLVLFDLPLAPDGPPRFLQQLKVRLGTLADQETNAGADDGADFVKGLFDTCPTSPIELTGLKDKSGGGDWTFDFAFNAPFVFPFLNFGNQFLQVTLINKSIDPSTAKISCTFQVVVQITDSLVVTTQAAVSFDPSRMAFEVDHDKGLWLLDNTSTDTKRTFLGLTWTIEPTAQDQTLPDGTFVPKGAIFNLASKNSNYQVRQAPGSIIEISYDRATMPGEPIIFRLSDFALTPKGVDLKAEITDKPARFNGLETQFKFTSGVLQVHENRVTGFTITGSGPLPPALVGDAVADVALQFGQASDGGPVRLVRGAAKIKGSNLLRCQTTRFDFSLDGLGLEFVENGNADHLYFTLSGRAKYAPIDGLDDPSGPLAWLPSIEIQLVDCPLTGNMRVIAQHVKFLIELPKKLTFNILGCFQMEIRAIGFVPQFDALRASADPKDPTPTSAMQLSGQIMFADGGGDVIETKIDFHDVFVALPERGSFIPRIHCKGLALTIKSGDAFELSGEVDFFDHEPVDKNPNGTPIFGDGFAGNGSMQIQGLPKMTATFAFLRVSSDGITNWRRAWFLYLEAQKMSIQIPVVEIFIREIGLGFGYRYTLASIKTADQINDPRKLLQELKRLSQTQNNLSSRDSWRVDLEDPGEGARWTVALRALVSETSAQPGPFEGYDASAEGEISCLFVMDVVLALRSDLTFLMSGRAWINTNYNDFHTNTGYIAPDVPSSDDANLGSRPLFTAFVLLSPRQKRFLANLSSNQNAAFGNHPPLPDFLKSAIRDSKYTATLLVEPDLFHLELGWPNQLQWQGKLGPLQVDFEGGAIFRVSTTELVVGNSFLARGTLNITAGFDAGVIGASLSAMASVAYGARYIGVLDFTDVGHSAFYGAVGLEIHVTVSIDLWIKIPLVLTTITLSFHFSFGISFTAALEVGITLAPSFGVRGLATIGLELMGHSIQFDVHIAVGEDALNHAIGITNRFLHIGLEAEDVEAVPGTAGGGATQAAVSSHAAVAHSFSLARQAAIARFTPATPAAVGAPASLAAPAPASPGAPARVAAPAPVSSAHAAALADGIKPPDGYTLVAIEATNASITNANTSSARVYFLMIPNALDQDGRSRFISVPPDDATISTTSDFRWTFTAADPSVTLEHVDPRALAAPNTPPPNFSNVAASPFAWTIDWNHTVFPSQNNPTPLDPKNVRDFITYAYLIDSNTAQHPPVFPVADPDKQASFDAVLSDDRVQNPSDSAYESAVRGAFAQVSAPFFKFDEQSVYDGTLRDAFSPQTTIYHQSGSVPAQGSQALLDMEDSKRAIQFRGSIVHAMLRDVQLYATLDDGKTDTPAMQDLRRNSLAFRTGLVFRATGPIEKVHWLESGGGSIEQRTHTNVNHVDSPPIPIVQFNPRNTGFVKSPPAFQRVRKFEHAEMIAIAWDLRRGTGDQTEDPEHHLSHYLVRRVHLNGKDPDFVFSVKKGVVLHLSDEGPLRLQPRFQLIDRFDGEVQADVSALTEEGKVYLYTVVPVDLSGNASPRPLSIVATRLPMTPPLVPGDGELVLEYHLPDDPSAWSDPLPTLPTVRVPDAISFQWSDPPPAAGTSPPPVETYRLVFRRENALPIGFFGADSDTRGGRTAGFPVTNARTLRADQFVDIHRNDPSRKRNDVLDPETGAKLRADSGRVVQQVALTKQDLANILPADGKWRPDAWRVFVQTIAPRRGGGEIDGVPSALAAVTVRYRFVTAFPGPSSTGIATPSTRLASARTPFVITPFEERKLGLLEWIPNPIRFKLLPPEDESSRTGFAYVPMPRLDQSTPNWGYPLATPIDKELPAIRFEANPERVRALQMRWNQGPSGQTDHPIELHAKYQLFEFDADAKTGELLEFPSSVRVTPSSVKAGDVFTLTLKGKSITFKAVDNDPSGVVAGLAALWTATSDPDFRAIGAVDAATSLILTANSRGVSFTVTGTALSSDGSHTPAITIAPITTRDVRVWQREAGLRVVQEIELMPADDLPLNPADVSKPVAWDVWTPATSRRIMLRAQMIDDGTWPETTDPSRLGPWYSWRDSFLIWPQVDNSPKFDPATRTLWPFHSVFRDALRGLITYPDSPASAGKPWPLSKYSVEVGRGPSRSDSQAASGTAPGGGSRVNPYPDPDNPTVPSQKVSALAAFMATNAPKSDPHGWGLLDRMGLAVTFRIRTRLTGDYVIGQELAELVRQQLYGLEAARVTVASSDPPNHPINTSDPIALSVKANADGVSYLVLDGSGDPGNPVPVTKNTSTTINTFMPPSGIPILLVWGNATVTATTDPKLVPTTTSPSHTEDLRLFFVEYLFQPGARTEIRPTEKEHGDALSPERLLALARLSLRPKVQQRMRYQQLSINGLAQGTQMRLKVTPGSPFLLKITATNDDAAYLIQTGTPGIPVPLTKGVATTVEAIMPKDGQLNLALRGQIDGSPAIASITATALDNTPLTVSQLSPFSPTDWASIYFAVSPSAPWASVTGATKDNWNMLQQHLKNIRSDLTLPDPSVPANANEVSSVLSWLDRFFAEGGDIEPNQGTTAASTGDGPWVVSAYPRSATPMTLTPDDSGRMTYYHMIEDQWGHAYRYFLRPQGRYDLLWAAISQSTRVFTNAKGVIASLQSVIEPPEPGGMDVTLERIRPLAAPLVLSSRRLDPPVPAGQSVAPGAVWEVLVAKHPEQSLIEKNRALVNHLGFRQVAHTLVRSLSNVSAVSDLANNLMSVVTDVFASPSADPGQKFTLIAGKDNSGKNQSFSIDLGTTRTLTELVKVINTLSAGVTASVEPSGPSAVEPFRVVITPAQPMFPLTLLALDSGTPVSIVCEPLDLSPDRFELAINSVPTNDPRQIPPPALPGPPSALDHLDLANLGVDDAFSLDLPLRSKEFGQGLMALQWRALPFYYRYKLMLIAQSSAVVSPITVLEQRDFQYLSPAPRAVMEGVQFPGGRERQRKITIRLERYWDCLTPPPDSQKQWATEDPASVGNGDATSLKRRISSIPDPDVNYQVVVTRPSRNVEVVAEYRRNPNEVSGYESRVLPGPFRGVAVRALPPPDGPGIGTKSVWLETLLERATDLQFAAEPVSSRGAFAGATAAGVAVSNPFLEITACVLRIDSDNPLTPLMISDLASLADQNDASFAVPVRQLLAQTGNNRYAEACVGLEQLAEIHDTVTIDAQNKNVTWTGPISSEELQALNAWVKTSLFTKTLSNLIAYQETFTYAVDPKNPTQADTTIPADRLEINTDRMVWSKRLTDPATAAELAALNALKGKAGLPAAVVSAITSLIADVTNHANVTAVIPIAEPFWKPRTMQASLPQSLSTVMLIGNGVLGFRGLMTLQEGKALEGLSGLGDPDKKAVERLFDDSLNSGLDGGTLEIRARRGGALPATTPILGNLSQSMT